ncbi:MAG: alpha/beta hydrolase [Isosphaeraceae bacterium]
MPAMSASPGRVARPVLESLEGRALMTANRPLVHAAALAPRATVGPMEHAGRPRVYSNLVYLNQRGRQEHLDLYVPSGPTPPGGRPVILALPGGGWRWVRRADLGVTVSSLTKYGYVVAVADYAFSSGAPGSKVWPTNFQDVRQAVQWLRSNSTRYGIDPNRVAVWGESAGGHLAGLLGTYPQGPGGNAAAAASTRVQAVVDFYGPTDLTKQYADSTRARQYLLTFLGGRPDQVPDRYTDASPVTHVSPGDPPFLIFQGTIDQAVPPSQSAELADKLKAAGVPHKIQYFPLIGHGFRLKIGPTIDLLPTVLSFLDSALNRGGKGIV